VRAIPGRSSAPGARARPGARRILELEVAPVAPRWIESSRQLSRQLPRQLVPGSSSSPGALRQLVTGSSSPGALRQLAGSVPAARRREFSGSSSPVTRPRQNARELELEVARAYSSRPGELRKPPRCSSSRSPGATRAARRELSGNVLDVELPGKCPYILRQMSGQTRPHSGQGTARRHIRVRVADQLPPGEHLAHSHTRPVSHAPFATGRSGRLVASSSRGCAAASPP